MSYQNDQRIVMSLDAGGTNFVFTAIRANREIVTPLVLSSNANDLQKCLDTIVEGFTQIRSLLPEPPVAISFAFPGPSDYPNGIIGNLGNLPAFRGGVALGPMLEDQFKLPVFINNDGDLYTYGESFAGFLPHVNHLLEQAGSPKRFRNLAGFTLGTGFGAGIVRDGELFLGDNSLGAEVWLLRNKVNPGTFAEEGVSIRAVRRVYARLSGIDPKDAPSPREIFEIAEARLPGDRTAAVDAFRQLGEVLGDVIANVITLIDGLVVIGGGIAGAGELILPSVVREMRGTYENYEGVLYPRLVQKVFNLDEEEDLQLFLKGDTREVTVPRSSRKVSYDPLQRIGIGISRIGTSKATALGTYAFALHKLGS